MTNLKYTKLENSIKKSHVPIARIEILKFCQFYLSPFSSFYSFAELFRMKQRHHVISSLDTSLYISKNHGLFLTYAIIIPTQLRKLPWLPFIL